MDKITIDDIINAYYETYFSSPCINTQERLPKTIPPTLQYLFYNTKASKQEFKDFINSSPLKKYSTTKRNLIYHIIDITDFNSVEQCEKRNYIIHGIAKTAMTDETLSKIIDYSDYINNQFAHYSLCLSLYYRLHRLLKHKKHKCKQKRKRPNKITPALIMNEFCHAYIKAVDNKFIALDIVNCFKNHFGLKKANSTLNGDYKRIPKANMKKL